MSKIFNQVAETCSDIILRPGNPNHQARRQQQWIQDCVEGHEFCRTNVDPFFSPTRLIDVRSSSLLRVVNSAGLQTEDKRYAALSYCWGKAMPENGKTTTSTLMAHQKKITLSLLPRTLRDFIKVTRSLAIPFLWVDALCIVQDDPLDRDRELTTMAKVYSCSTITIAAEVSDNCDGGFLLQPQIRLPWMKRLDSDQRDYRYSRSYDEKWVAGFFKSPLFSRRWCLQERELSPRMLHFTTDNVIFECRYDVFRYELANAHLYSPGMPAQLWHPQFLNPDGWQYRCFDLNTERQRFVRAEEISLGFSWHKVWQKTITEYSLRKSTDTMDKLPAIAGLAEAMSQRFEWNYLAGLWRENLIFDLLWQRNTGKIARFLAVINNAPVDMINIQGFLNDPDPLQAFGDRYVAPSWSWASVKSSITYDHYEIAIFGDSVIQIIETNTKPSGAGENGKLDGGFLKVSARLKALQGCVNMEAREDSSCTTYEFRNNAASGEEKTQKLWVYWDQPSDSKSKEETFVCLVIMNENKSQKGAGLALRKTGSNGDYRRVGLVTYIPRAWFEGVDFTEVTIV